MKKRFGRWSGRAAVAAAVIAGTSPAAMAVDYANIVVTDGATPHVDPPTVSIPAGQGTTAGAVTEGFFIDSGAVVGEFPVRIGASSSNDADNGVMIVSIAEFGRTTQLAEEILYASPSTVRDDSSTATNTRGGSGGLSIVTKRAGNNVAVGSSYPLGASMNANVGAAYFPFSQGWVGGTAINSVDGGTYDQFVGSPGLQLGVHVLQNFYGPGDNLIKIPGIEDTRRQGILLATHGKNEDNMTVVSATNDGDGYNLTVRGNSQNGGDAEPDPISFVFMPLGTPNVTMANIWAAAGATMDPTPLFQSGSDFTIAKDASGTGAYRLSINGESPTSGTLIVTGGGNHNGDGGLPADNLVTYRAEGNDWVIVTDDLPDANGVGQAGEGGERESVFSFVFLPFDAPPTAPGPAPALNYSRRSVLAYEVDVTELDNADNDNNDGTMGMYLEIPHGTANVNFIAARQNKGDNGVISDGALPTLADGVMLATISEGLRDNSATGGPFEFGVVGASLTGSPASWEIHTAGAAPNLGEQNLNYSVALFGADTGFPMAANVATATGGVAQVNLPGVNSLNDGVLMVTPYGNVDNFTTAEPKTDGSGWDVMVQDNSPGGQAENFNYVFLPYETENLVAGRVNADGSLVNSTDTGAFTLVKAAAGEYLLTVNGRTPEQGMLLLTATGLTGSIDNAMAYEADGNSFRIFGIDMVTTGEFEGGTLTSLEDTSFSFAFIDYLTPPTLPGGDFLSADFNEDGFVDGSDLTAWKGAFGPGSGADADDDGDTDGADFLAWQRQFGQLPVSEVAAAAVPEPTSVTLVGVAVAALGGLVRRRR